MNDSSDTIIHLFSQLVRPDIVNAIVLNPKFYEYSRDPSYFPLIKDNKRVNRIQART